LWLQYSSGKRAQIRLTASAIARWSSLRLKSIDPLLDCGWLSRTSVLEHLAAHDLAHHFDEPPAMRRTRASM
jgi:hypothetical protein